MIPTRPQLSGLLTAAISLFTSCAEPLEHREHPLPIGSGDLPAIAAMASDGFRSLARDILADLEDRGVSRAQGDPQLIAACDRLWDAQDPEEALSALEDLNRSIAASKLTSTVTFKTLPADGARVCCLLVGDSSLTSSSGLTTSTEILPSGIYLVWAERPDGHHSSPQRCHRILREELAITVVESGP